MEAVILFSHGSLLCGAGEALWKHAERIRDAGEFDVVEVGYLNYSDPPFLEAVRRCAMEGATRILVAPYFLVPGKFVRIDLPAAIAEAQRQVPDIDFRVAEAIGCDESLTDAILLSASEAQPAARWRDDLKQASQHCRKDPTCPLYGTPTCPRYPGTGQPYGAVEGSLALEWERGRGGEGERFELSASATSAEFASPPPPPPFSHTPTAFASPPLPLPKSPTPRGAALLIVAHGSPRPEANTDFHHIVEQCRARNQFAFVQEGFLECNAPSIPGAIDLCAASGVSEIRLVPYFLHTGTHVADDIPTIMEECMKRHPDVTFLMGEFIGRSACVTEILRRRINAIADEHKVN